MRLSKFIIFLFCTSVELVADNSCTSSSCGCECVDQKACPQLNSCCDVFGQNIYVGRSQGNNFVRREVGLDYKTHKFCMDQIYGAAEVTFQFQENFRRGGLAVWFSPTGNQTLTYGLDYETDQTGNGTFDINAINFGVTSSGTISFCPQKSDFITDFYVYTSFDQFVRGLWASVDIPIVHTKWNMNLCDRLTGMGGAFPVDSVGSGTVASPFQSPTPMKEAFQGLQGFGDAPKLNYARICGKQSDTTLANMRFDFGYDFISCPKYFITGSFDFVLPVASRPDATFVFNATCGNYRRWEAGGMLMSRWYAWHNCCETSKLDFTLLINLNHIYARTNQRTLSLDIPGVTDQQKNWSQYLLLKKFNSVNQAVGLERAANITTGDVKVSAGIEVNILAYTQFDCGNWTMGLGYEFWARSAEKLMCRYFGMLGNTYAVKGSTEWNGSTSDVNNNKVAPTSTISKNGTAVEISASDYLSNASFLYAPALHPSAFSNKIFGYFGRTWQDCTFEPFLLAGAEVEFAQHNRTWNQWSVFGKAGLGF